MNPNVILTSDFPSNPHPSVVERVRAVARTPRVAWIAPDSAIRRIRFLAARYSFSTLGLGSITNVELVPTSATHHRLANDFDVVYLSGGSPVPFRANLAKSGLASRLADFVTDGGLVVAASGGAMQLTQNLSLYRLLTSSVDDVVATRQAYEGLGVVDVEFLPHLNRHASSFMAKVQQYSETVPNDIVALEDGGALWWVDQSKISCAGRGIRIRHGVVSQLEAAA